MTPIRGAYNHTAHNDRKERRQTGVFHHVLSKFMFMFLSYNLVLTETITATTATTLNNLISPHTLHHYLFQIQFTFLSCNTSSVIFYTNASELCFVLPKDEAVFNLQTVKSVK